MKRKGGSADSHLEKSAPSPGRGSANSRALRLVLLAAEELRLRMGRQMGLSRIETVAVEHLMGESLGPVELSRRLHISTAAGTLLVDRLQEASHVTREQDSTDRRRRRVRLLPATRRDTRAHIDEIVAAIVRVEHDFTSAELDVINRYLRGLAEQLSAVAGFARED